MQGEFLARPTWNPVEVVSDPRVTMTAVGTIGAYVTRKAAYVGMRSVFGFAAKDAGGNVKFYAPGAGGAMDMTSELPNARLARLALNGAQVAAGSILIGRAKDANLDYLGLGLAAAGFANVVMTLLGID
ncbi:MAG: hypothetical protein KC422_23065 [Trueperaceae bacterium]|nr:hypothetical protein [Trueperaceae bacterium]